MEQENGSILTRLSRLVPPKQLLLAALFFAFFSLILSWKFALILMGALLFHEFGHAWAMKLYRVKIAGFYFLPPVGLAVVAAEPWPTRKAETVIALMGPAWGLVLTAATYGVHLLGGGPIWAGIAGFMAMINLFNLAPINPLDGGRVAKSVAYSISPTVGFLVLTLSFGGALFLGVTLNLIIGALVAMMAVAEFNHEIRQYRRRRDRENVTAALAGLLKTDAEADTVLDALQKEMDLIDRTGRPSQATPVLDPSVRAECEARGWPYTEAMKIVWSVPAAEACRPYVKLFGCDPLFAVADQELLPVSPDRLVRNSPLGKFLLESELPTMTGPQIAGSIACYLAIGAALAGLLSLASKVMSLTDVLQFLR